MYPCFFVFQFLKEMASSAINPNAILENIYVEEVKLDEEAKHESNKIIEFIREVLIRKMCENNGLFNAMYRELYYTGSSYDGLKISEPDEYDLNLILDPKIPELKIFRDTNCKPGYVLYGFNKEVIPKYLKDKPYFQEFLKLMKSNGTKYVMDPNKVKKWVQDILNQSLPSVQNQFGHYGISDVTTDTVGTAITLNIFSKSGLNVDVDLVPVFSFKGERVKKKQYIELWDSVQNPRKWIKRGANKSFRKRLNIAIREDFRLVPKVNKNTPGLPHWHLNFRHVENQILMDKQCAKKVIKLLKCFRDFNHDKIGELFSYCLKTIVVQLILKDPNDNWNEGQLANYFLKALKFLTKKLENRKIEDTEYIFGSDSILFYEKTPGSMKKMVRWLNGVIQDLEQSMFQPNCENVWKSYF